MLHYRNTTNNAQYWDQYYSAGEHSSRHMPPSQFAAFCLIEINEMSITSLVEIASGNGRDALFFAKNGVEVLATDKSKEAVHLLESKFSGHPNIKVAHYDATEEFEGFKRGNDPRTAFYARFFIHTLDEFGLEMFFRNVSGMMRSGDVLFLEYRNTADAEAPKVTKAHFRAFHEPDEISKIAQHNNLELTYEVGGKGFAKWKQDDAFITRQIFERRG